MPPSPHMDRQTGPGNRTVRLSDPGGDDPAAHHRPAGDGPVEGIVCLMSWFYLLLAGLLEIGWAVGLKYTDGFTRLWPSLFTALSMLASISLLGLALKGLPLGTAYAVWTGIGAVGTVLFGMIFLGDSMEPARLLCLGLIIAGIVGLKLLSPA